MDNFLYFVLSDTDNWVFWDYDDFYSYVYNDLPNETFVFQSFFEGDLSAQYFYVDNKLVAFSIRSVIN